jgi:hypothetical protein
MVFARFFANGGLTASLEQAQTAILIDWPVFPVVSTANTRLSQGWLKENRAIDPRLRRKACRKSP